MGANEPLDKRAIWGYNRRETVSFRHILKRFTKGAQMLANWLRRLVTHLLAYATVPVVWWYFPKVLLVVMHLNIAAVGWVVRTAVDHIPNPDVQQYTRWAMKPGELLSRAVNTGLEFVPEQYRDRVEVLVRLKYDPGAWITVTEIGAVYYLLWIYRRRHRERRTIVVHKRHQRIEPTFGSPTNTRRNE
jgi:hypothetical protein